MKSRNLYAIGVLFILQGFFPAFAHSQGIRAIKDSIRINYTQKDYELFLQKEKRGEIPSGKGKIMTPLMPDGLVNNNIGSTGSSYFTQSETTILAYSNHVIVGFNDAGSYFGGTNKFTGYSYSTDGGATFTDGGTLPTNPVGDAGDPVLARDANTGRIYFAVLGFQFTPGIIQVFRSDDNALTWMPPVVGTPGGNEEDKPWITVDNSGGPGNGNVYIMSRRFGTGPGMYFFRSTDGGTTFGPVGGSLISAAPLVQGAYVTVGPNHAVYAFYFNGLTLNMRKSTDLGLTFGPEITVVSGLTGGVNGDLGLTGLRQGTGSYGPFRSNEFPHVAVNPVSGHIYVTFDDNPPGTDKGQIYLVMSTDGGASWGPRMQVNDDGNLTDQWMPTIAVTPDGSKLGIFYYSRKEDPVGNNMFKYNGRVAVITSSILTFSPSFVISDVNSLPEFGRDAVVNSVYMGDYNCAAATNTDFHVVWSDNRDDLAGGAPRKDPNVYYKSIPFGDIVARAPLGNWPILLAILAISVLVVVRFRIKS